MAGESYTTTDHDVIRKWVEERGGQPVTVKHTSGKNEDVGVLRISFPNYRKSKDESLKTIPWEDFFDKFEKSNLAFLYQNITKDGKQSRFFKFIARNGR